ncbi:MULTISPECIES: GNAT family N-acetyltransferase [unclassified Sphingomonas]|uniref:GNAT family N-acetyltransferase n=1 Tax=unclassified Sphingomonas TaxID=196159 RepID=UPI0006FBF070|nr:MULTISPECIES: GNAT family N-acetyltransferase [unclassified Sphingomonas]KQX17997.1 GNAT family acetyltransferase [Sphingomonas sp. Root1294]KQY70922.1 GNAT family acetyltransferase [Sphingomonas sp. Root50]KRB91580.1 GNAT family acetyltransferase [Sphingomonas sp. Root720]
MSEHPLDRPIWDALGHRHAGFALGDMRARRYRADISPFAAARDASPEALAALAALLPTEGGIVLLEAGTIAVPPGAVVEKQASGVQMVAGALEPDGPDDRVVTLTDADAPEMLALATLTEPGPFLANTHMFGGFIGVRIDGRLAAMAGERLKPQGHCEVSGVCTHPEFRGRGLAGLLSRIVANRIAARGETPFLHAYATNTGAIRLYEALGFRIRTEVSVLVLRRA